MNKGQRKVLAVIFAGLNELANKIRCETIDLGDAKMALDSYEERVGEISEEEREKFDNMPEGLQASPTGEAIEDAADALEYAEWPQTDDYDATDPDSSWRDDLADAIEEVALELDGV